MSSAGPGAVTYGTERPPNWLGALWRGTAGVYYVQAGKDGPIKIDARTGSLLWRSAALRGKEPPAPMNGYAPMVYADSLLYVPTDGRLTAIDLRDGRVVSEVAGGDGARVSQELQVLQAAPLVVGGEGT